MKYIKTFSSLRASDVPLVGGKNASLGQMIAKLSEQGIRIPDGFATTADAYWYHLEHNNLLEPIKKLMGTLKEKGDVATLQSVGKQVRALIADAPLPPDLVEQIRAAYHTLSAEYDQQACDVAVRSSATAEDLPDASFAGQQETYLNVQGDKDLIIACAKSMASLFTDRAIVYRQEKGFDHFQVALSVGVQKMVRSDTGSAGVSFTLDTESGFKDAVVISSSYGLGESVVKGTVTPDEFVVHKPTLEQGFRPIIQKILGSKKEKIVYAKHETETVAVSVDEQHRFSLSDDDILELARFSVIIEQHYAALRDTWSPMDIEWAKDGNDGQIYIIQARPETVHSTQQGAKRVRFSLLSDPSSLNVIVEGLSIGQQIACGPVRVVSSIDDVATFNDGDILVTHMTDPDWVPLMKKAGGIITDRGGRTCHAAIVSRELGIPAVIGARGATEMLHDGQEITLDCSQGSTGFIYEGAVPFERKEYDVQKNVEPPVPLLVNIADPSRAFTLSFLPVDGVGLARVEFIISNAIKIHPMALLQPEKVADKEVAEQIKQLTAAYDNGTHFFVDTLAQGVGTIAAAFYPRPVIVRLSDFKTNEYRNLIGGQYFEPEEENPMLGFRGASRYYAQSYAPAFALECQALKKVRDEMGLTNVKVMVPFVRTVAEGRNVVELMQQHGLTQHKNGLEFIMMVEVPSNALLIESFATIFDGFSIGSNDLTQLTLGVDRDSELLADLFDERDEAVKDITAFAIRGARKAGKPIGICGQGPSDFPEFAQFLIDEGISSISLNPDAVLPFLTAE